MLFPENDEVGLHYRLVVTVDGSSQCYIQSTLTTSAYFSTKFPVLYSIAICVHFCVKSDSLLFL
jgi:hypothetical protein